MSLLIFLLLARHLRNLLHSNCFRSLVLAKNVYKIMSWVILQSIFRQTEWISVPMHWEKRKIWSGLPIFLLVSQKIPCIYLHIYPTIFYRHAAVKNKMGLPIFRLFLCLMKSCLLLADTSISFRDRLPIVYHFLEALKKNKVKHMWKVFKNVYEDFSTIRLFALDFYRVIVNYHAIEI